MLERMTRGKIQWESDSAVKTEISPLTSDSPCSDISLGPRAGSDAKDWLEFVSRRLHFVENDERKDTVGI